MITQEFRPSTFSEVSGQEAAKMVLKAIVAHPQQSPRTIILHGSFGTGKTTLSRVFARSLNCKNYNGDPCMKCPSCLEDTDMSSYYVEYDSSLIGNVESIRELRDSFYTQISGGYRVITLDEVHICSKQSMSALLKVLEESPEGVFFILATTDVDKVLPTIRSRSIELRLTPIPHHEVSKNLQDISRRLGRPIPPELSDLIATKSRGHMRNAHMMLDQYYLIDNEQSFRELVRSPIDILYNIALRIAIGDTENLFKCLELLQNFPMEDIREEFPQVVYNILRAFTDPTFEDSRAKKIADILKMDSVQLFRYTFSDWFINCYSNDISFAAGVMAIYQSMRKSNDSPSTPSPLRAAKKP